MKLKKVCGTCGALQLLEDQRCTECNEQNLCLCGGIIEGESNLLIKVCEECV